MTLSEASKVKNPEEAISRLHTLQFERNPGEARELAFLPKLLEGCDRFIDVGANIGLYLFHANRALANAEILAIEANPRLVPAIEDTWKSARQDADRGNRFSLESCAILDETGSIDFFVTPLLDDSSIFSSQGPDSVKITIPARPLDDFYRPSRKTIIKMDIEGAEYRALRSAERFLGSNHTEFFLELHPWGDSKIKKYPLNVCNLFYAHGYGCRRVHRHYHFIRMNFLRRTGLYFAAFPHFLLMWLPYRYPGLLGSGVKRLHRGLSKLRRAIQP